MPRDGQRGRVIIFNSYRSWKEGPTPGVCRGGGVLSLSLAKHDRRRSGAARTKDISFQKLLHDTNTCGSFPLVNFVIDNRLRTGYLNAAYGNLLGCLGIHCQVEVDVRKGVPTVKIQQN